MTGKQVVVIGAGFGGLSIAAMLAKDGHQVTLLEKNAGIGGRASWWQENGYGFDMGPSWYLMPEVFEELFVSLGTTSSKALSLTRLDPHYRIFFGNDSVVDISANLEENLRLFDSFEPDGGEKLRSYLEKSKYMYEVAMAEFIDKPYRSWLEFFNPTMLTKGPKLKVFSSLETLINDTFVSDQARKILLYTIVFLGGNPKITPALYALMAHIDFNIGVFYPQGGMHAVAKAIAKRAKYYGTKIQTKAEVTKIMVEQGKVTGVETSTKIYPADIVVSGADYAHTETKLLGKDYQSFPESYWKKATIAPSAFIMYLGVKRQIPELAHHSLFFDADWQRHFSEIFDNPQWSKDPSFYLCVPSKSDSQVAPKGCENIFVLVPLASGLKDSPSIRKKYRSLILSRIESMIGYSIEKDIEVERTFAHHDFESDYNAYKGTALGLSHTLRQTAIFRPKNWSKKVKGLYYVGQYTNPGIGVPMTMISARIVRRLVEKDYR